MKNDLASAIIAAIAGVIIAYFVCNIFIGPIEDARVKTVEPVSTNLVDPNPEVFNYKAINPTVEVYVGDCEEDIYGKCIDNSQGNSQNNPDQNSDTPEDNNQGNS